jgi:hypothetical protein
LSKRNTPKLPTTHIFFYAQQAKLTLPPKHLLSKLGRGKEISRTLFCTNFLFHGEVGRICLPAREQEEQLNKSARKMHVKKKQDE